MLLLALLLCSSFWCYYTFCGIYIYRWEYITCSYPAHDSLTCIVILLLRHWCKMFEDKHQTSSSSATIITRIIIYSSPSQPRHGESEWNLANRFTGYVLRYLRTTHSALNLMHASYHPCSLFLLMMMLPQPSSCS